jgi:asparagine synthetase B (glutamine-hydrolysing)
MAFNGEVYNYLELRDELIKHGHKFISRTDTEVVLAAYAEWGAECVKHFIGMWSFIIYDRKERKVFISRDPFGIKPHYIFKINLIYRHYCFSLHTNIQNYLNNVIEIIKKNDKYPAE